MLVSSLIPLVSLILPQLAAAVPAAQVLARQQPIQGFPKPSQDEFYSQPDNLASYGPGQIIRTRPFLTRYPTNVSSSSQFLYRSNDDQGSPIGATGAIFFPETLAPEPKLVVYNVAEDAASLDCAPSWVWVNSTPTRNTTSNEVYLNWAVSRGYYLVSIDFEGPNGAWLDGKLEGQTVLDGVRAALSFLKLPTSTPFVTSGFSGGAHTTAFAANEYARGYASELNFVAAAHGGTPVDLVSTYKTLDGSVGSQLALYALLGLSHAYPGFQQSLQSSLTWLGTPVLSRLSDLCPSSDDYQITYLGPLEPLFTVQPLDQPALQTVVGNLSLLNNVSTIPVPAPKMPRFIYHGESDEEVPFAPITQYVQQQCDQGADIRFVSIPGTHFNSQTGGLVATLQFMGDALEGNLQNAPCGSPINTPAIGSPEANDYLGPHLSALAQAVFNSG